MNDLRVLWTLPDGSVSVTTLIETAKDGESNDDFFERVVSKSQPVDGVYAGVIAASDLPAREFRAAWRVSQFKLVIDTTEAKKIIISRVRKDRDRLLRESDADAIHAMESGKPDKDLAEYRQKLRELPATLMTQLDSLDNKKLRKFKPVFPVLASGDNTTRDKK